MRARMQDRAFGIASAFVTAALLAIAIALGWAGAAWADDETATQAGFESSAPANGEASEGKASSDDKAKTAAPATGETAVQVEGEDNRVDPTQRADNSFIYDTTVESLFSQASLYEGKIVQVSGEVIGDIVSEGPVGGKYCWITLTSVDSGNSATISVLLSNDQANQIDHLGRYGVTGTTLQVRGVYHQACSEHEGIPDIHATNSSVLARGSEHPDSFELDSFLPGFVALALGAALMGLYYFVRERSR